MKIFTATLQAVSLLTIIGFLGFILVKKKVLPQSIVKTLNPLILDISLPLLIFHNIISKFEPNKMNNWYILPLWWIAFTILSYITAKLFSLITQHKNEFLVSILYPNYIFYPLAIITAIFGENSQILTSLFIFVLIAPLFVFNTYFLFFKKEEKVKFNFSKSFNPVIIATIIAIIIKLLSLDNYMPKVIYNITKTIGAMALPLIMIVVGASIYIDFKNKGTKLYKGVLYFVLIKNIILPLLVLFFLNFIKMDNTTSFLIFLLSTTPPLTAVPILIEKINANSSYANQCLVLSFLSSIVTIPLLLSLYSHFFNIIK